MIDPIKPKGMVLCIPIDPFECARWLERVKVVLGACLHIPTGSVETKCILCGMRVLVSPACQIIICRGLGNPYCPACILQASGDIPPPTIKVRWKS